LIFSTYSLAHSSTNPHVLSNRNGDSDRAIDVTTISDSSVDWCLKPASDCSLPKVDYYFRADNAADRIKWVVALNAERSCRQSCSDLLRQPTRSNDGMEAKDMKRPTRSQATARTVFHPAPSPLTSLTAGGKLVDPKVLLLADSPTPSTRSADDLSVTSPPVSPAPTTTAAAGGDRGSTLKRQSTSFALSFLQIASSI
jgi:hypothetical protein